MVLKLKPLFAGEIDRLPIDAVLDLSGFAFHGAHPFPDPVQVKGEIAVRAGLLWMKATAFAVYHGECDRCLTAIERPVATKMEHIVVSSLNGEETDELVLAENEELELEPLTETDLFLDLPQKMLCKSDCRGLCQHCGKNLNDGLCGCREQTTDPRLAVLAKLLEKDSAE